MKCVEMCDFAAYNKPTKKSSPSKTMVYVKTGEKLEITHQTAKREEKKWKTNKAIGIPPKTEMQTQIRL